MDGASLEPDGPDVERKLYSADSLNNLHKMHVCCDLRELLAAQPLSPQRNSSPGVQAVSEPSRDSPKTGVQPPVVHRGKGSTEDGCEEEEGSRTQSHFRLLSVVFLILATALISSLALSSYAVYLMVQTTDRLAQVSSDQVEEGYLAELRHWKALMSQYLADAAGVQAQ